MKEIDNKPSLSDQDKAPLLEKLTVLVQLHADIKEKWDTCKDRFVFFPFSRVGQFHGSLIIRLLDFKD